MSSDKAVEDFVQVTRTTLRGWQWKLQVHLKRGHQCDMTNAATGVVDSIGVHLAQQPAATPPPTPGEGPSPAPLGAELEWREFCSGIEDDITHSRIGNAAMVFTKMRSAGQLLIRRLTAAPQGDGGVDDRAMLVSLLEQFDSGQHVCPRCQWEEGIADFDMANELREYLSRRGGG